MKYEINDFSVKANLRSKLSKARRSQKLGLTEYDATSRHCEEHSDAAIRGGVPKGESWIATLRSP
jgi:hypothetical protein